MSCYLVWSTKYHYKVLEGDLQYRYRDLLIQICNSKNVQILKGVVSKGHIRMHVEDPPYLSICILVKKLKGRSSRLFAERISKIEQAIFGHYFWAIGYGAWSRGKITDDMVQKYLEHHKDKPNSEKGDWVLE